MFTKTGKQRTGQFFRLALTLVVIVVLAAVLPVTTANAHAGNPFLAVNTVVKDSLVKVLAYNLPRDETFTVRMNTHGTLGIGGYSTATFESGNGASRLMTFETPSPLYGEYIIDLRIDSNDGVYSATTSFVNAAESAPSYPSYPGYPYQPYYPQPGAPYYPVPPTYSAIPTTSIVSVVPDSTVTLQTYNFPANTDFTVRMGAYGTYGVNGIVVGTTNSGAGGSFQVTYSIPSALKGLAQIAIRFDSASGFFAYDWFNNVTASSPTPVPVSPTPAPVVYYYSGIPTFAIAAVVRDSTVTVSAYNFPPNQTFNIEMNYYGTYGLSGFVVGSVDTGSGGSFQATYSIPSALKGLPQIAIRMDSTSTGYYAYNWFWNNTYP